MNDPFKITELLGRINSDQRFPLYLQCEETNNSNELKFSLFFLLKESGIKKEYEWKIKKNKLDMESIQKTIEFFNTSLENIHWSESHSKK